MSQPEPSSAPDADPPKSSRADPQVDPWQAFGYLVSGVAFYGFLGWLLDRWWGTSFMVAVGILAGAGLGIYLTHLRTRHPAAPRPESARPEAARPEAPREPRRPRARDEQE